MNGKEGEGTRMMTTLATTPVAWAATHPTACRRLRGARAYDTGLPVDSGIWERGCNKLTFPSLPLGLVSTYWLLRARNRAGRLNFISIFFSGTPELGKENEM